MSLHFLKKKQALKMSLYMAMWFMQFAEGRQRSPRPFLGRGLIMFGVSGESSMGRGFWWNFTGPLVSTPWSTWAEGKSISKFDCWAQTHWPLWVTETWQGKGWFHPAWVSGPVSASGSFSLILTVLICHPTACRPQARRVLETGAYVLQAFWGSVLASDTLTSAWDFK